MLVSAHNEDSQPPAFNDASARQIVSACDEPPTHNPQQAGLRAAFAVHHRHFFSSDQDAWQHYASSRQRYYEWKPSIEAARSSIEINALIEGAGDMHTIQGNMTVQGDLHVSGRVYAEVFVPQGPPGAPPPPPSPPYSDTSSVPPPPSPPYSDTSSVPPPLSSPPLSETTVEEPQGDNDHRPDRSEVAAAAATGAVAGAVAGGATAAPLVVAGVQAAGFGAGGIASGSTAAAIMSAEAISCGGSVVAGGTTATLQSIGATASLGALGAGSIAAIAITGAVVGAALVGGGSFVAYKMVAHKPDGQTPMQTDGMKLGKWNVIIEKGPGNIKFYQFGSKDLARRYFKDEWNCRIIFNEYGEEVEAGGWNRFTLDTIRAQVGTSPNSSANGFRPEWLVPGTVVALHNGEHNRFIRMMGKNVDARGGTMNLEDLPAQWHSERFTVVDAGSGQFAFHSAPHGRFMRMVGSTVDSKGGEKASGELPDDWDAERFIIVDAGNGLVALHSKRNNRFVKMDGSNVNGNGWNGCGCRDAESLPNAWASERFKVVYA